MNDYNKNSLDTLCSALCYGIGIEPPKFANEKNQDLANYFDKKLNGKKADRLIMYNPDAVAEWIFDKYSELTPRVSSLAEMPLPLKTVMPSVTPVCFGTMYTGAQPEVHGIKKYEKPVIKIDTFFDAALRAGKKIALCSQARCSMSIIYQERSMDYFIYETIEEINAKAVELIMKDEYDIIVIYNTNYDAIMHKNGPEHFRTLAELKANDTYFGLFYNLVNNLWKNKHDTILGFAMDHGCHEIDGGAGSHGLDMVEDINIKHSYVVIPKN